MVLGGAATRPSCRARPATASCRSAPSRCSGSRRRTCPGRTAQTRPAAPAGARPACHDYTTPTARRRPVTPQPDAEPVPARQPGDSLLDVIVDRLAGQGPPAHQVWLPPLDVAADLDELLGRLVTDPARGRHHGQPGAAGRAAGAGRAGGQAVRAAPRRGLARPGRRGRARGRRRRPAERQVAPRCARWSPALALTHTPAEVQVYCLDFGGGALGGAARPAARRRRRRPARRRPRSAAPSARWPRCSADRERRFAARGIDSMATFRRLRRPSDLDATLAVPEDGFGDVFLVVDGWATLRSEFEDLEPVLTDIATRGPELRHPRGRDGHPLARLPAHRQGPVRLPAGAAPGRPGRLDRSTARPPPTCRPARPAAASPPTGLHVLAALPQVDRPTRPRRW